MVELTDEVGDPRVELQALAFSLPIRSDTFRKITVRPLEAAHHGLVRIDSTCRPDQPTYLHRIALGTWRITAGRQRESQDLGAAPEFSMTAFDELVVELLCD